MKNALILHGTDGTSQDNWFPWLQAELERIGYKVWTPNLPQANKPNIQRYNDFILANTEWVFDQDSIVIGHSSGAVAILGLLQALPSSVKINACYLVGSFKNDLGWEKLSELFVQPFGFAKIKQKSRLWYFLHSDNDPHCPLEHAEYLHDKIGGDLIVLPGQKHFSVGTYGEEYRRFPYLFHLIAGDAMQLKDVAELYQTLTAAQIKVWLDGGWGVDALLGEQTRSHGDVDIVIQQRDVQKLNALLKSKGYWEVQRGDTSSYNYMYGDAGARFIDIHVVELDTDGNGKYGPEKDGIIYPAAALTGSGKVGELEVHCISPEWVVKFHSGYQLRQSDFHDVLAVCKKFGIEVPEEYLVAN